MSNINFKEKAQKYKLKYHELKQKLNSQHGGMNNDDYRKFKDELHLIYTSVNGYYYNNDNNIVLTGSGAIAFILKQLGMDDDINSLSNDDINPHDLDFLYISPKMTLNNPDNILDYVINPSQKIESSVTFSLPESSPSYGQRYIKSFDISKASRVKCFELDGIHIINLKVLKEDYIDNIRSDKDTLKINLLDKIINTINEKKLQESYGLGIQKSNVREISVLRNNNLFDSPPKLNYNDFDFSSPSSSKKRIYDSPPNIKINKLFDSDDES
jgi:hypothetical protein